MFKSKYQKIKALIKLAVHSTMARQLFSIILCLLVFTCSAQYIPKDSAELAAYRQQYYDSPPPPVSFINDFDELFNANEKAELEKYVRALNADSAANVQIAVITLSETAVSKEKFDDLIRNIANKWGVGNKDKNNGVLIGVCKDYRLIRISTGLGLPGRLPDEALQKIIDTDIVPLFRDGRYFEGLLHGIESIKKQLKH